MQYGQRGLFSTSGSLFGVILRLCVPQLAVFAVRVGQQRFVGPLLDDLALVEHRDLIAELAGGQPVADINGGLSPAISLNLA